MASRCEIIHYRGGSSILPYYRVVYGLARVSVPNDRGLSLIGHSNCSDHIPVVGSGLFGCVDLGGPDGRRVMFNPSRTWKDLAELFFCRS